MPSEKILNQKKEIVAELAQKMRESAAGVLVDYRGLTVEQDTKLRAKLREANIDYRVVKNTLTRLAAKEIGFDELDPILNGPTALALSKEDPVAAAKVLCDFAKTNDNMEIKAGFVDGRVIGEAEVKALASLPSKEELIAKMLGSMNAPISGFVNVLNANIRGLVVALNAIAEKKSA